MKKIKYIDFLIKSLRQAHLGVRLVLKHWMAEEFTEADGSDPLYFGREIIMPGAAAWPLPHDAPYKPQLDTIMMTVVEVSPSHIIHPYFMR